MVVCVDSWGSDSIRVGRKPAVCKEVDSPSREPSMASFPAGLKTRWTAPDAVPGDRRSAPRQRWAMRTCGTVDGCRSRVFLQRPWSESE